MVCMRLFPLFNSILRTALDADGQKIVNLGTPTQDTDAATKKYVDDKQQTIVLDDTVTEESPNVVKSSGIWSWVKSLLPHWLTSDYAEPATVESVATKADKTALGDKRDKGDLAVYEVVRTENTDWTWTSDDAQILSDFAAENVKPKKYENWSVDPIPIGYSIDTYGEEPHDSTVVTYKFIREQQSGFPELIEVTATRPRYMDEMLTTNVVDRLATTNGVNAAIAKNNVGYRVRESVAWSGAAELAMNANGVRSSDETRSGAMLFDQIDGKATKTELAGYLPLTGGYLKGPIYFDAGGRIYTDQGGISVNTPQGLNVYGGGSIVLESNECLTDFGNNPIISATNPAFSNAALSVGLNIDTNSVAVLNEIASTFGGFPIEGTATTVGGLLAALAAATAWLKKNKVGSFASVGDATASVENGVAILDGFFTNSNSLLTATIDTRLPYPLYPVTDETGLLKDRAINTTSLASVTVPDNFTDLLVRASVASSLAVTMPEAIATKYGDTFPGEAGE